MSKYCAALYVAIRVRIHLATEFKKINYYLRVHSEILQFDSFSKFQAIFLYDQLSAFAIFWEISRHYTFSGYIMMYGRRQPFAGQYRKAVSSFDNNEFVFNTVRYVTTIILHLETAGLLP